MALEIRDRVKETCTGTNGDMTLTGAVSGFVGFDLDDTLDGDTIYYALEDADGTKWEVGLGTLSADSTTLARTTILATQVSFTDTTRQTFSGGTHTIFATYPASKAVYLDASGNLSHTVDLTSEVTGTLPVGNGGTGLTSIATLLNSNVTPTSLGLVIGTNVQAYDAQLATLAGLTANQVAGLVDLATLEAPASDGQFVVATGAGAFAYESGATARTSLGLGDIATQDHDSIDIDGGNIDGATIATSDITVGSSKTLDVSAGTLTTSAAQNLAIVQGAASNIDIGAYELRAQTLESDVSTGTAPLTVASTTVVANLNADKLDGQDGSYYLDFTNFVIDNDEIPIAKLAADKVTIGSTDVTLGATVTTFAGLASVTSTAFVGDLTGDVTGNVSGSAATVTGAAQSNITSLGTLTTLTVDNITIDASTIDFGGSTGANLINLTNNIASALDIQTDDANDSYMKFNTQTAGTEVTYSKEAVEISKPLKCTKAIHSSISKTNAVATSQSLKGGGTGNVVTLDLAEAGFFRVQLTANVDEIWFKNQSEGQKVIIRFEQDGTGSRTVDLSDSFYATDGTAVSVQWPSDTPPTLTTTASKADLIGLLNFGIPAGSVHWYNAVVIGQNFD